MSQPDYNHENPDHYDHVIILLHWLISLFIFAMIVMGNWMTSLPEMAATIIDLSRVADGTRSQIENIKPTFPENKFYY